MTGELGLQDAQVRQRAIDPARSFIVQAPAGSGKTSLLTQRYLRLLAEVEQPEQIVAITFTRKAAAEMRHRVVRALADAARPARTDAPQHEIESRHLALAALAASARRGWDLEHNPARLHIQTIDGLGHWLARRLPLAARIGTDAALLDDARPLYAEAARRTVLHLDRDEPAAAALERLARAVNHDPRQLAGLIESMLGTRELWLPKLFERSGGEGLRGAIDALLESAIEAELAWIREGLAAADTRELFAVIREAAAGGTDEGPLAEIAGLTDWPGTTLDAVSQWLALARLLLRADPRPAWRKTVDRRQGFPSAKESRGSADRKQRMQEALAALAGLEGLAGRLGRARELPPRALSDAQWEKIDALCGVLPLAVAELLALFAERDRIDHPAVAAAARAALGDESAPTELALALDYRIRHLLVDEYQDTSPAQERLLGLLVAGWHPGDGRTLFCVGDPMQSIYGFREADVTLFLQAQRAGIGGVPLEPVRLSRNFRSSPAIVDWVNAGFAGLLPPADDFERGAVRYTAAVAERAAGADDGVSVHALLDADPARIAKTVADIACQAQGGGVAGDCASVAILVRGRSSLPPILAALRDSGIEYRGVELESLTERAAVRDLVALAKALLHAGDRTAWLAVLRAPWCGLTLADLIAIAGGDPGALVPARLGQAETLDALSADGRQRATALWSRLAPAVADRGERSLGSWLKAAWLAIDGPATVEDASDLANAELLFDAFDRLEAEAGCMPEASLIDAAVEGVMASPVGGAAARVQVMTIHRAKGLEFDVVIVPDLQRGVRGAERPLLYWTPVVTGPDRRGIVLASRAEAGTGAAARDPLEQWMRRLGAEREWLELGRVAYVAATRARKRLHLVGSATTRATDDAWQILPPSRASLLGFFWPALAAHFEDVLARRIETPSPVARGRPRRAAPPLLRLPVDFRSPVPAAPPRPRVLRIAGAAEVSIRPEFDWAGTMAQAVGQVVHLELHRLVQSGRPPATLAFRPMECERRLRELGIDAAHLPESLARIERALLRVAGSALASRLLDPAAIEGSSELALTAHLDGVVQSLRIDRSFIDADGVRWIVDWKTSAHEGGDLEAFLDNELARYTPQLRRYAEALALLDPRPQRVGLYFPLHDAWREL